MKFKRYLFLRSAVLEQLQTSDETKSISPEDAKQMDALTLAYVGDGVYSLYVREHVIRTTIQKVRILHDVVTNIICAKAQAQAYHYLENILTDDELAVGKNARNSHLTVPKSATVHEYRLSTALEAVIGFLYLSGQDERLAFLCQTAFAYSLGQIKR